MMKNTVKTFSTACAFALAAIASAFVHAATDIANIAAGTRALPAGYTQLEYAQTDGSVYSSIGVKEDFKGRVEIKFSVPDNAEQYLWGIRQTANTTSQAMSLGVSSAKKITLEFGSKSYDLGAPVANEPYYALLDYGRLSYSLVKTSSGETQSSGAFTATTDTESTRQIQFFAVNNGGKNAYRAKEGARVYYFKYYGENGTLKLDAIPVKVVATGAVGFYDSVRGDLLLLSDGALAAGPSIMAVDENTSLDAAKTVDKLMIASGATLDQNGQTFSAAAVATFPAVPAGFTRLASLHVNNNVVFKTQYRPGASDKAEIKVKFTERTTSTGAHVLFGARSAKSGNKNAMTFWHYWDKTDYVRFDYGNTSTKKMVTELTPPLQSIETDRDYIFSLKNGKALVKNGDGQVLADYSDLMKFSSVADNASYMWLLGFIDGDTASNSTSSGIMYYACSTDFYWFKATDGSSVKCHFVPVRRESDGVVGMYDLTGRFGFVEPSIAADGAVTAGADVVAAGLALSSDVSIAGAVSASVPLELAKSGEAQSDITVAVPGTLSGAGGIAVGGGVTLDVGLNRVENSKLSFETGSAIALRLASLADEPVIHNVANEPPVVAVYGVDGTTLLDNAVATYDATEQILSVTVPSSYVWTNASGDGSFEDLGNWSGGRLPGANDTFEIVAAADTAINVSDTHAMGHMVVKGGHEVAFSGAGSLSVLSATVGQDTTLATGGVVSFGAFGGDGSIVYSPGEADALTLDVASTLGGELKIATDRNLAVTLNAATQVGTLTVTGAVDVVVTIANGTGGSFAATGGATVQSGVLKQGSANALGATPRLTVENGGTFDINALAIRQETPVYIAGAGAGAWKCALTSSSGSMASGNYLYNLYLTGDATVDGGQLKLGADGTASVIGLGGHTLTAKCTITFRNINTAAGTLDVYKTITLNKWNNLNSDSEKYSGTTLKLRSTGKIINQTLDRRIFVTNLEMYGGKIDYDEDKHGFGVLTSFSGYGTVKDMQFASGATFKPHGTEYLAAEAMKLSGKLNVDTGDLSLDSAVSVPLFKVASGATQPDVASIAVPDAGKWKVETSTSDGYVCYDLVRKPASVHIGEIDADVALPAEWLKEAGMAASFDSADGVKAFAEGPGANGIPVWKSYCLGLDPKSAASVVVCEGASGAAAGSGKIAIKARNVRVPEGLEGAAVRAVLEKRTEGGGWEQAGDAVTAVPGGEIVFETEPESGAAPTFYRIKIAIAPASASAD